MKKNGIECKVCGKTSDDPDVSPCKCALTSAMGYVTGDTERELATVTKELDAANKLLAEEHERAEYLLKERDRLRAEVVELRLALRNVMRLAGQLKLGKQVDAPDHLLRFCRDVGIAPSVLRNK